MREDMQKRKQQAMRKKGNGSGFEVEIAGAEVVEDLLQESNEAFEDSGYGAHDSQTYFS